VPAAGPKQAGAPAFVGLSALEVFEVGPGFGWFLVGGSAQVSRRISVSCDLSCFPVLVFPVLVFS
jgi:hypothetical protein